MDGVLRRRHLIAGGLFVLIGGAFALLSLDYRMGTIGNMGPGFLPFWLGLGLALTGAVTVLRSMQEQRDHQAIRFEPRQLFLIIGAILLFAFLLIPLGLIGAVIVMTVAAGSASDEFTWRGSLLTALLMAAIAIAVFVLLLGLPIPLLPDALSDWGY